MAFPERHLCSILEKSKCKFAVFHAQCVFTSVDFDVAEFFFFLFLFNFSERFLFDEVLLWLCSVALLNFYLRTEPFALMILAVDLV